MWIPRWNALKSGIGKTVLIVGYINYILSIIYIISYRSLQSNTKDSSDSLISGNLFSQELDGFRMLAYFDGFVILGLGSWPAFIMLLNFLVAIYNAYNIIKNKDARIARKRRALGIPTDNFERYNGEFDFEVTDEDI